MALYDLAVLGLGAMGSASAYASAARGARVIAFDRHLPPHALGSSHGRTRIIREAYYEHPLYVPLVRRAFELWKSLERGSTEKILLETGGLMVGPEHGPLVRGAFESALAHNIPHEMLDAEQLQRRFPPYRANKEAVGLLEHRAGMLFPERCIQAHLDGARASGADLRLNEAVDHFSTSSRQVTITTNLGTYTAERLVLCAGPWLPGFTDSLGVTLPLEVERQLSHWFEPEATGDARYDAAACPVALWEMADGDVFATLPNTGDGVKCGMHHSGATTSPESVNRTVTHGETAVARELLETVMPGAGGRLLEARVCLYTNTPDRHFIIDWLAGGRVLLVSACSGHGFKFASAIGEIAAQLAMNDATWLDLSPFALRRFARA